MAGRPTNLFSELHNTYEEDEIKAYLWPFYNNFQFQTMQDICFKLDLTPGLMHIPLSYGKERVSDQQMLNTNVATASDEKQTRKKIKKRSKEQTMKKSKKQTKKKNDDSWMTEGWTKEVKQRPPWGKFPGYKDMIYRAPGVKKAFRSAVSAQRYIEKLKNASILE